MKTFRIALAIMLAAMFSVFIGCGGGGGGSAPAPTTDSTATQTQAEPTPTVKVAGKVVIDGVDDYSGVVVVAEKSSSGVTARVQAMLDAATDEKEPGRISARAALNTPGVYTTETNSEGNYTLNVPEGKYSVSAYKDNTLAATPRILQVTAGQTVTVDFELVATGSISGTISYPYGGGSASGTGVGMAYLEGTSFAGYAASTGNYTITNVPVGTYNIVFTYGGVITGRHTGIEVAAGETTNNSLTSFSISCSDNSACDDGNANTIDTCSNAGTESATCTHTPITCSSNTDCDDGNAATTDTCTNPGTASAACSNANSAPTAVTVNAPSGATVSSINISWSQSSIVDFASYKIYYGTSSGVSQSSTLAQTITTSTTTSATLSGLSMNTTYYVKVYVCDTAGQCTASNEVSAATLIDGTYISGGPMLSNTTWTLANSPYVIQGTIQVAVGVTLTIEPGVTIYSGTIEVHGSIIANGTAINKITFDSNIINFHSDANVSTSQFDYVIFNRNSWSWAIIISSVTGTLTVNNSTLNLAGIWDEIGVGTAPIVVDNLVCNTDGNIDTCIAGYFTVSNSSFTTSESSLPNGSLYIISGSGTITNSTFNNAGISASAVSNCVFDNSAVSSGTVANSTFNNSTLSSSNVSYSSFSSTTGTGTAISSNGSVTYTDITGYSIGVSGAPTTFNNNNIYNNTQYNFKVTGASNVTATNNWWGTTNTASIEAKLYDKTNDLNLGEALYNPPLGAAQSSAGDPD